MSAVGMDKASVLKIGFQWQNRGVPVFPIAISWDEGKKKTNKQPLTAAGHHDATLDSQELTAMFNGLRVPTGAALGLGLRPGPAGFVVFDQDIDDTKDGVAYARDVLKLPPHTYTVTTASGGLHAWYRKRDLGVEISNSSPWAEHGIDIRSDGGWVVAPGITTPWGSWAE